MVIPENFPNISPIASSYPGHWVGRVTVLGVFFGARMAILWMKHDEFDLKCRELPFWVWSPPRFGSPVIVFANDDLKRRWGGKTNPCHEATPLQVSHLGASRRRIALSLRMECCQVRQRRRQDIWEGKEMW